MSFDIPTPTEIQERLETEASLATGTQYASLAGTAENMVTRATTIITYELYCFIAEIALQILPPTAAAEFLDRHASFWLETGRKGASGASGTVTITGTAGVTVAAGTEMTRPDGELYSLSADATIEAGGTVSASVESLETGADMNTSAGIVLTLSSSVVGVSKIVVATDGLTGGADQESDYYLEARIEERVQDPPQGGSDADYKRWAKEVSGVTRAWAYSNQYGLGTVGVTFVMDEKEDTIIPTVDEVQSVQDYIDQDDIRPVTADVSVFAPTELPIDFEIAIKPNSVAVQTAIKAELEDFFLREAEPGTRLYRSRIQESISAASGEFNHVLTVPAADIEPEFGELPVLGEIAWSTAE